MKTWDKYRADTHDGTAGAPPSGNWVDVDAYSVITYLGTGRTQLSLSYQPKYPRPCGQPSRRRRFVLDLDREDLESLLADLKHVKRQLDGRD